MTHGELMIPPLEDHLQILKPLRGDQQRATLQSSPQLTVGVYWSQRSPKLPLWSHWFSQERAAAQKLPLKSWWKALGKKW
ncbi:hypothetical protein F2Q70_00039894 [Brassica cretica]|uniref:Uncharacterized protein n=1 Tax=Brassica cretica TaxID=69181 RepID=A0A8S9KA36_BRACR|nr:hypothetical protein F2Q70_00039894 [Brassica cretica]